MESSTVAQRMLKEKKRVSKREVAFFIGSCRFFPCGGTPLCGILREGLPGEGSSVHAAARRREGREHEAGERHAQREALRRADRLP
jgi:hypothetical protein